MPVAEQHSWPECAQQKFTLQTTDSGARITASGP
jgi:hypothetical protein